MIALLASAGLAINIHLFAEDGAHILNPASNPNAVELMFRKGHFDLLTPAAGFDAAILNSLPNSYVMQGTIPSNAEIFVAASNSQAGPTKKPEQLLNDLGLTMGLPDLSFNEQGCARLEFDSKTSVNLESDIDTAASCRSIPTCAPCRPRAVRHSTCLCSKATSLGCRPTVQRRRLTAPTRRLCCVKP